MIIISYTLKDIIMQPLKGQRTSNNFLQQFIDDGLEKWEKIKNDFSHNKEMFAFLKKSYLVVAFDHQQFDIDFVKNLYRPLSRKGKELTPEEIKAEELRKQMVSYYENNLKELTLEVRFPTVAIELIQELKIHTSIKDLNSHNRASIKVIISHWNLTR